ncbi:MAG: hypothetical protein VX944_01130 [Myxococcota bacterium]|nr:hypothetical protein [Myxococcota bacterium]
MPTHPFLWLIPIALMACRSDTDLTKLGNDSEGGSSAGSDDAPINSAPSVAVTLNPTTARTNTVLAAVATADDPDGDALEVSYRFSVDGTEVQEGDTTTLDGAAHFSKGQTVRVTATADDGVLSVSAESNPVTILNSPPTGAVIAIDAGSDTESDDTGTLTCLIEEAATDDDDDPIDYRFAWHRDGAPYTGPTESTLHANDTIPGETIAGMVEFMCTVTPNDGEEDGPATEALIRVGDRDGDGVADDTDCAPDLPDIPRFVTWSSVSMVTMDSSPPSDGAVWCDGSWGDQGVRVSFDRTAWFQESDWNSLWIVDPISDDEMTYAVDVDLHLASGNRSGEFGINRTQGSDSYPGACNHSAGGLVMGFSQGRCGGAGPCLNIGGLGGPYYTTGDRDDIFDRWVNMRFEVFRDDGLVQFWIDDELETCFFADDAALVGPKVKFNANASCCGTSPNLGISKLNFSVAD